MPEHFTTRDVAELYGVQEWQVRRLYESGDLADPPRFAGRRLISRSMLPGILDALRRRGWIPTEPQGGSAA